MLLVAFVALALTPGCFMFEMKVKVHPDGSSRVDLRAGISQALLKMGQPGEKPAVPDLDVPKDLPEGWTIKPLDDADWKGWTVGGAVPLGQELIRVSQSQPSDPKAPRVKLIRRLFSTEYFVEGTLIAEPPGGKNPAASAALAPGGVLLFTQAKGDTVPGEPPGEPPFDPQALMQMMGALGSGGPSISLVIKAPGAIVETNGQADEDDNVTWRLDLGSLLKEAATPAAPQALSVKLHTRLVNHQNLGRLADLLAGRDLDDMAALLADYVSRDLLPNPPREEPLKAVLDVDAYECAMRSIAALENVLAKPGTAAAVKALGLNADGVTGKRLVEIWKVLKDMPEEDLAGMVGQAAADHLKAKLPKPAAP